MEVQNAQHGYNIGIGKIQALKISLEIKTGILKNMFLKGEGYLSTFMFVTVLFKYFLKQKNLEHNKTSSVFNNL